MSAASPIVVGVEQIGEHDWMDVYGHYWAWNPDAGHWDHNRSRCRLNDGRPCEKAQR